MRVFTVPAMYAPEVLEEIRRIVDRIDRHRHADAPGPGRLEGLAHSIIPESSLARSAKGALVIAVDLAPADSATRVFDLVPLKAAS
jgi:hypothetical protein